VARSLREGLQYVAGFVLGAVLSIPAGLVLGPSIAGIAVVIGLAVNVLVFPPLQLRPAEHAVRQWGDDLAGRCRRKRSA